MTNKNTTPITISKNLLRLFVLGYTPIAKRAIENLNTVCNRSEISANYAFEVINLYDYPEYAEQEKIIATPLLIIKNKPSPMRLIGDLSNKDKVLEALIIGMLNYD
ncbi:circadian clock KaiB family protein [Legionella fallonii]|uniref:KaiB domain-containing protein n=1 Tax=Legionella fallonii LLAP-10 TaxID=1212491 RepID=A0A098G993_9GAMM|nr:circadian clock KaiB family protein [Legionella fallonii]CEG58531.1 conserved protein of unknown function [Legionella fallonii LLAP-10]